MHYQADTCRAKVFSWLLCSLTDLGDRKEDQKGCIILLRDLKSIFQEDTGILRLFPHNFSEVNFYAAFKPFPS